MDEYSQPIYEEIPSLIAQTETPAGEIALYESYIQGEKRGVEWARAIKMGLLSPEPSLFSPLLKRELVKSIVRLSHSILKPHGNNFTSPTRTPWGGEEICRHFKTLNCIESSTVVGESWEISAHRSFPNTFTLSYDKKILSIPITLLEFWTPTALYGKETLYTMPFLVKLLNSGSWKKYLCELEVLLSDPINNAIVQECEKKLAISPLKNALSKNYHEIHLFLQQLQGYLSSHKRERWSIFLRKIEAIHRKMVEKNLSIQLHPSKGDYSNLPSKAEAWVILSAEKGAGVYLGLREGVTKESFKEMMMNGEDLSSLLNFVEVEAGDLFFIPTGTLHAIGAGILLIEPQETSESTFRAYDWGRVKDGVTRQLHFEETLQATKWDSMKGKQCIESLKQKTIFSSYCGKRDLVQTLIDREEFTLEKISLLSYNESYHCSEEKFAGYFVSEGCVEVTINQAPSTKRVYKKGDSFLIPASISSHSISKSRGNSVLFKTTKS